jgi:pseudouridine-5'-phosphate glycosidase
MPYPQNVETALKVEEIVRENGAVPATIAVIGGRLKAGLTPEEIEYFGKKGTDIAKASRRDLAALCARGEDGATTVTTTMMIAHMAGISLFATGGIGGVHRGDDHGHLRGSGGACVYAGDGHLRGSEGDPGPEADAGIP